MNIYCNQCWKETLYLKQKQKTNLISNTTERKPHSEVCEECPMGVWRCCARLCLGADNLCSLPQVGFCASQTLFMWARKSCCHCTHWNILYICSVTVASCCYKKCFYVYICWKIMLFFLTLFLLCIFLALVLVYVLSVCVFVCLFVGST